MDNTQLRWAFDVARAGLRCSSADDSLRALLDLVVEALVDTCRATGASIELDADAWSRQPAGARLAWSHAYAPSRMAAHSGAVLLSTPISTSSGRAATLLVHGDLGTRLDDRATTFIAELASLLGAAMVRCNMISDLSGQTRSLLDAQRHTHVGSFEWDIATGALRWSDEMVRIYGEDPENFTPSFDEFVSHLHPDDRDHVIGKIQDAVARGGDYFMTERVIRPSGDERRLHSWGDVITDDAGNPVTVVGCCQDVTEQYATEQAIINTADRLRTLIASAPDGVVIIDSAGVIREVNDKTCAMFGYGVEELLGQPIEVLVPERFQTVHHGHRTGYLDTPSRRAMGVGLDLTGRRKDGTEFPVDVSLAPGEGPDGIVVTAFVRDITARRQAEEDARRLRDIEVARQQALEINDNIVQGLAAAAYSLDAGAVGSASTTLAHTLDSARSLMNRLLGGAIRAKVQPGDLVRESPAPTFGVQAQQPQRVASGTQAARRLRVVIADDSSDMRLLLRMLLPSNDFDVVGEASNGEEAVAVTRELEPDAVVLDLAMPVMDGLQALPLIRAERPQTKVVVLSGFDAERMADAALVAGAARYLEKGQATSDLASALREACGVIVAEDRRAETDTAMAPDLMDVSVAGDVLAELAHELRTPLTVISGMVETLIHRSDSLPSAATRELLETVARNASQLDAVIARVADAQLGVDGIRITPDPVDVATVVADVVRDLGRLLGQHPVRLDVSPTAAVVDVIRLRQVLTNLLSNAVKFSPPGTEITVSCTERNGWIEVSVRDQGPGVPHESRPNLFGKFVRLHRDVPGLGLGLYVSRGIARAHGGDLILDPDVTNGSRFVLRLPVNSTQRTTAR